MTCLLSLPDNEMKCVECGFMECYILIILYHLLHICFLYKIMLKVFFAFLVMWYTY